MLTLLKEDMYHLIGGDNFIFLVLLILNEERIIRMAGKNVIGDRTLELVNLYAHTDFVTVLGASVLVVVNTFWLNELQAETILIAIVANLLDEDFSVTGESLGYICLTVFP